MSDQRRSFSMKLSQILAGMVLAAALAVPGAALAQKLAYAVGSGVNMRAGPGTEYPVIGFLPGGSGVTVFGCIRDRRWCDVGAGGIRGWVNGNRLEFVYQGRRVLLPAYYSFFAAPIIGFDFGYWDLHYRNRPFYRDRDRFRRPDRDRGGRDRGGKDGRDR
jgi:uncharacterized protein YraI